MVAALMRIFHFWIEEKTECSRDGLFASSQVC